MSEWKDVNKETPEDDAAYLCSINGVFKVIYYNVYYTALGTSLEPEPEGMEKTGCWSIPEEWRKPDYWMEIPKIPKK